jgi:hypothetical protein
MEILFSIFLFFACVLLALTVFSKMIDAVKKSTREKEIAKSNQWADHYPPRHKK